MISRLGILRDMLAFFGGNRKFWLLPLVIALIVVAIAVVFAASSAISALIYPLF